MPSGIPVAPRFVAPVSQAELLYLPPISGSIRTERDGALAYLVVDHPERRNALNAQMWRQIPQLAAELDADRDVHVVIMRGVGDEAFVSGADISEFSQLRTGASAAQYDLEN